MSHSVCCKALPTAAKGVRCHRSAVEACFGTLRLSLGMTVRPAGDPGQTASDLVMLWPAADVRSGDLQ